MAANDTSSPVGVCAKRRSDDGTVYEGQGALPLTSQWKAGNRLEDIAAEINLREQQLKLEIQQLYDNLYYGSPTNECNSTNLSIFLKKMELANTSLKSISDGTVVATSGQSHYIKKIF